jgi:hypothetical protein
MDRKNHARPIQYHGVTGYALRQLKLKVRVGFIVAYTGDPAGRSSFYCRTVIIKKSLRNSTRSNDEENGKWGKIQRHILLLVPGLWSIFFMM